MHGSWNCCGWHHPAAAAASHQLHSVSISVAVRLSLRASDGRSIASAFVITVVDLDEPDYGSDVVGRSVLLLRRNAFR